VKPKIALIGVGRFGKNHLRVLMELHKNGLCSFKGVVDRDPVVLENVRRSYGVSASSGLDEILESEVDAVDVVTPSDTHFQVCKKCLESGKHVFVEKPLTTHYADAKKLVQIAAGEEKVLMAGLIYRYNSAVKAIKGLMDSGELGKIHYMFGHYMGFKDPRNDVGALINFGVHHIDIYDYLLGELPEEVASHVAYFLGRENFEDLAFLFLRYANDVVGTIEGGWLPPGNYRDLVVVGSRKSVTSDLGKQTVTIHNVHMEKKDAAFKAVDDGSSPLNVTFNEPLKLELQDFLECVETGRKPVADGETASKSVLIAETALKSARLGKTVRMH
jgi:predicted dehydrogenase